MPAIPDDYPVQPRALDVIESAMNNLRSLSGYLPADQIEPYAFLSSLHITLKVRPIKEMRGAKSFATSQDNTIAVTHDVARGIRTRDLSALYLLGHEVAHLAMHRGSGPKARLAGQGNLVVAFIPPEESAEEQAWIGSRALFVPRELLLEGRAVAESSSHVGIPIDAVQKRIEEVQKFDRFRDELVHRESRKGLLAVPSTSPSPRMPSEARTAWERAAKIQGEDPAIWRSANGHRVRFDDFAKQTHETPYGWCVWAGRVCSYMEVFQRRR